jgi:hypothetical protein
MQRAYAPRGKPPVHRYRWHSSSGKAQRAKAIARPPTLGKQQEAPSIQAGFQEVAEDSTGRNKSLGAQTKRLGTFLYSWLCKFEIEI